MNELTGSPMKELHIIDFPHGGETVHLGDTAKQIELTKRVISEILKSRRMDRGHEVRVMVTL